MNKFRFLEWEVYKDSKALFAQVLEIVQRLPREHRYELGGQITRSAFSIVLNIAEGSGKSSDRELNRFIDVALGSANETLAAIDVFHDNNFITEEKFGEIYRRLDSISNQLGGFKRQISRKSSVVQAVSRTGRRSSETGVSLYIAFMIMTVLLGMALGVSTLLISEIGFLKGIGNSVFAFYATDTGVERALYLDTTLCAQEEEEDRASCLEDEFDSVGASPPGSIQLSNGASYQLTAEAPGEGNCPGSAGYSYCVKSAGTFEEAARAVRIGR